MQTKRRREREREHRKAEEKQIRARGEESVMYEGTVSIRVCSCSREHIAPISARRVSGSRGHRPFLASPLALPCAPQIARVHTILLSAASSSSLFPETSPSSPPASFYLAARVHPCTDVHFCTPWRVSKDGEIRFAPRENGVIIYEGGNKKKGINQRGGRGGGYFCQKLRWSEKGLRKLTSSPSIPRNRGRTRKRASRGCPSFRNSSISIHRLGRRRGEGGTGGCRSYVPFVSSFGRSRARARIALEPR